MLFTGVISHVKIIFQNDNSDTWNRQVTLVLPIIGVRYNQGIEYDNQRDILERIVMARRTLFITYLGSYLAAIGNIIRTIILFWDESNIILIAVLHGVYLALLISERIFIYKNRQIAYIYMVVQIVIIWRIATVIHIDHWAGLIFALVVQAMYNFPIRTGISIIVILSLITSYLMISELGTELGLPLILTNLSGVETH
jgi:hypothetical protein